MIATTVLGSSVAMLTATVVNVALPSMAADLGASSSEQQWVVNAYLLTLASLILIGGSLGDRFGRLRVYRIGVAAFALASLGCALAPSTGALIALRLAQGVGGALLTPGSLAIIQSTLRREDRGRGVGLWSGLGGIAGAVGPLLGGLLVDVSWRWVFVVNLPIALAALLLSRWVPERRDPVSADAPLDVVGAALIAVTLGGLSYALIQGPATGIGSPTVLIAAVGSALAGVALVSYERGRPDAIVPVDLLSNRPFVTANAITLLVYGGMGLVFFLLSIQLQVTTGWSPLESGLALLPVTVIMLVLSSRAGGLAQRVGPRWPLTFGPLTMAVGIVGMSRVSADTTYLTDLLPSVLVFGLGLAASVAPVTSTALGTVPDERSGAASGANNAVARTGQLLAVAAIPAAVGLGGNALSLPAELDAGFGPALSVGAVLVATGGVVAGVFLRSDDLCVVAAGDGEPPAGCAVDGPPPLLESVDRR